MPAGVPAGTFHVKEPPLGIPEAMVATLLRLFASPLLKVKVTESVLPVVGVQTMVVDWPAVMRSPAVGLVTGFPEPAWAETKVASAENATRTVLKKRILIVCVWVVF